MKYGCHNSERLPAYYAPNGTFVNSEHPHKIKEIRVLAELVLDRGSRACQYDRRAEDNKCEGCNK